MASKCAVCKNEVDEKKGRVQANDRKYHIDCFKCDSCKRSLINDLYTEEIGVLEEETPDMFLPRHIEHARLFCIGCTKKSNIKVCYGCKKQFAVAETIIRATGQHWHPKCFVCDGCGSKINLVHVIRNGKHYCSKVECAGTAPITSAPVNSGPPPDQKAKTEASQPNKA